MKLNKRVLKIVTVVVSTALLAFVVGKMHLSDQVRLKSGEVVKGKILSRDAKEVKVAGRETPIAMEEVAVDSKGQPDINYGVRIVVERAIDRAGMKWMLLALGLFGLPPIVGAVRWWMLMRMQGIELRMGQTLSLTYIGYLFNYIMLGLTGGDVVKAYYVSRETHRKTEAVLSVFMDRAVGWIALTGLGLAVVLTKVGDPNYKNVVLPIEIFSVMTLFVMLVMLSRRMRRRIPEAAVLVGVAGGGAIVAGRVATMGFAAVRMEVYIFAAVVIACSAVVLSPARKLLGWETIKKRLAAKKMVREVDASFTAYRKRPWALAMLFLMSVGIHVVNVLGVYACARALDLDCRMMTFMVLVPVIIMISSIPISVAGLGVQEGLFPFFFGLHGVDVGANEATMLAFMFRFAGSFVWVIPGWVLMLLWKGRPTVAAVEQEAEGDTERHGNEQYSTANVKRPSES